MLLERGKRREGAARQRVTLHELHPGLDLAFGARAIRCAGARLHVPVATEGQVAWMECHGAGRPIAPAHQRRALSPSTVSTHAAEVHEGRGDALTPIVLALVEKRFHEGASGITEDRDQQKDRDGGARDGHPLLPEINLHLRARGRFDAHRRDIGGPLRLANRRDGALHRAHARRRSPARASSCWTTTALPSASR